MKLKKRRSFTASQAKPSQAKLIMLANVCRCQAVLTTWIHSCVLSFLSVDMYRVCHIHLCKIYHAGIELSNVIVSLAGMGYCQVNVGTFFHTESFHAGPACYCSGRPLPLDPRSQRHITLTVRFCSGSGSAGARDVPFAADMHAFGCLKSND